MPSDFQEKAKTEKINHLNKDDINFYSQRLCFLWDSYNKVVGFGIISSAITVAYLGNYIMSAEIIDENVLTYIKFALISATIAGGVFMINRWTAQVIMEREVYADQKKPDNISN